jgi:hypothetical protein
MFYPLLPMYVLTLRAHTFLCSIGQPEGLDLGLFYPLFALVCWTPALVAVWNLPYRRSTRIWQLGLYILTVIPLSYCAFEFLVMIGGECLRRIYQP